MTSYTELLRDPRWQKKRLEIMQRDEFVCRKCFDSESTLNVHHCYYKPNAKPWDYEDSSLLTLCEECHKSETVNLKRELKLLIESLAILGAQASHISELAIAFYESKCNFHDPWVSALAYAISDSRMRQLINDEYYRHLRERQARYEARTASNG